MGDEIRTRGVCLVCGGPVTEQLTPRGASVLTHETANEENAPGEWIVNAAGTGYVPNDNHFPTLKGATMYDTFDTLPEPTTTAFALAWDRKPKREIETRWALDGGPEESTIVVDLTSSHDKERKTFRAAITWGQHVTERGYSTWRWSSDHAYVRVGNEPVARYSNKALEEFHARMLALVEAEFAQVQHVFAEALVRGALVEA